MINNGEPIDGNSINDLFRRVDNIADKIVNVIWKNAIGKNDKTIKSTDGKDLLILAGTVPVQDRTSKNDESSVRVEFIKAFGGEKDPTVVAMPESASPYGVSIKNVNKSGFTLIIHQFADNNKDDRLNLTSINYIAVGQP